MGSVALRFPDASTVEKIFPSFSEGGGDVGSMVRGLLSEHSLKAKDIGVVAVGIGPGSYTGTRVALTFAKVFAYTLGVPLYGRCGLEVLAFEHGSDQSPVSVAMPGHQGRLYAARYDAREVPLSVLTPLGLYDAATWWGTCTRDDSLILHADLVSQRPTNASGATHLTDRVSAASLSAYTEALVNEGCPPGDGWTLEPLYLQLSAPERAALGSTSQKEELSP